MLPGERITPYVAASVIAVIFSILTLYPVSIIELLEAKTYDWRFHFRGKREFSRSIAIVAIDERSIKTLGRWPWPRALTSRLIGAISERRPRVIGIDMIFSEPEAGEGKKVIEEIKREYRKAGVSGRLSRRIEELGKGLDADSLLAGTLEKAGNAVLPLVFMIPMRTEVISEGAEPLYIRSARYMYQKEAGYSTPFDARQTLPPLEILADASAAMGHIYANYDPDGVIRWEPLSVGFRGSFYPSFSLEAARLFLGIPKDAVVLHAGSGVDLGGRFIPTDESGRMLINYAGPAGTFPAYSAVDVLSGKITEGALKDKVVLVGTTAIGAYDIHVTPYANMPGVEKQASAIENIMAGNYLERTESQWLMVIGFIAGSGVILGLLLPRLKAKAGALVAAMLFFSYTGAAYYLFSYRGIWIDYITPPLTVFFLYASIAGYRYMTEERRAREIQHIFSSYVTEKVVKELIERPELAKLGGERKDVTILFSDIRGFTTFSEKKQPEEVVASLNEYLKAMTGIVFRWDGTLDKFIGDAVMVFWGAPTEQKNHAELAVRCALDMIKRLRELQGRWRGEGKEAFDIGIGIDTGEVIVGNMGAEGKKMDYTVIGDHVNLASRAEGLTREFDAHIIITEFTYRRLEPVFNTLIGHVTVKELASVRLKGKEQPITIYSVESID